MTIERAAKAIWLSRAKAMDKVDARILARAALEAIKEPTPDMIEELAQMFTQNGESIAREMWRVAHLAMMMEKT